MFVFILEQTFYTIPNFINNNSIYLIITFVDYLTEFMFKTSMFEMALIIFINVIHTLNQNNAKLKHCLKGLKQKLPALKELPKHL